MSAATFDHLRVVRDRLEMEGYAPSNVFVPWAGADLEKHGGIYVIGIAVAAEDGYGEQDFQQKLNATE